MPSAEENIGRLHGLTEQEIDSLLTDLVANAIWRDPEPVSPALDPGDNHLWTLLESHASSVLITGDHLLIEHPPHRASVVSPRTYAAGRMDDTSSQDGSRSS